MKLNDVNNGIHKHKKRTARRPRPRLRARQNLRPRAQRAGPIGRLVGQPDLRRGPDAAWSGACRSAGFTINGAAWSRRSISAGSTPCLPTARRLRRKR